ncbi:conjugal transfer protein TrbH [Bradyrhizobium sp. Arg68]|uniref:conjugal transfer protein TrbH n=1 Tax=Bradyrhizobium ivorense TaxID=2511166 RepID=UPI001E30FC30|nr:conjugal transfer protein TrbH [Bradyrhizobium ivorense]MCC8943106.1 conjugal transfer protein TrbH [Bradyrhizobium ivorense]
MNRFRILIMMALVLALGACATTRPTMSFVAGGLSPADAMVLANDVATHLADSLPPAKSSLVLDPPASRNADVLTPVLLTKLRSAGYGVIEADPRTGAKSGEGTPVRYLVSPLDNGVVLRLQYLGVEATRFYPRSAGGALVAAGPFTVRGGAQ